MKQNYLKISLLLLVAMAALYSAFVGATHFLYIQWVLDQKYAAGLASAVEAQEQVPTALEADYEFLLHSLVTSTTIVMTSKKSAALLFFLSWIVLIYTARSLTSVFRKPRQG